MEAYVSDYLSLKLNLMYLHRLFNFAYNCSKKTYKNGGKAVDKRKFTQNFQVKKLAYTSQAE